MHGRYGFDLVAPENHTQCDFFVGKTDFDRVAVYAECATRKVCDASGVERVHQFAEKGVACDFLPYLYVDHSGIEVAGITHAVQAAYG